MSDGIKIEKCTDPTVKPKCPSCAKPVERLLSVVLDGGLLNQSNVVVCPHCHTIVGYGKVNYF